MKNSVHSFLFSLVMLTMLPTGVMADTSACDYESLQSQIYANFNNVITSHIQDGLKTVGIDVLEISNEIMMEPRSQNDYYDLNVKILSSQILTEKGSLLALEYKAWERPATLTFHVDFVPKHSYDNEGNFIETTCHIVVSHTPNQARDERLRVVNETTLVPVYQFDEINDNYWAKSMIKEMGFSEKVKP